MMVLFRCSFQLVVLIPISGARDSKCTAVGKFFVDRFCTLGAECKNPMNSKEVGHTNILTLKVCSIVESIPPERLVEVNSKLY